MMVYLVHLRALAQCFNAWSHGITVNLFHSLLPLLFCGFLGIVFLRHVFQFEDVAVGEVGEKYCFFSRQKFGGFNISLYICGVKSVSVTIIIAYDYNIINIQ